MARQRFEIECIGEGPHAEEQRTFMVTKIVGLRCAFQYRHHAGNPGAACDADKIAVVFRTEYRTAEWAEYLDLWLAREVIKQPVAELASRFTFDDKRDLLDVPGEVDHRVSPAAGDFWLFEHHELSGNEIHGS